MRNVKDSKVVMNLQTKAHLTGSRSLVINNDAVNPLCSYGSTRKYFKRFETRAKYDGVYTLKILSDGYNMLNPLRTISKGTKVVTH